MTFINPYAGCKDSRRLNLPVPASDYDQLRSVLLNPRDLTTALGLVFNAIVTRCRHEQWDFSNRDDLVAIIGDCVDRIGGRSSSSPDSRRPSQPKRRRTASKDETSPATILVPHVGTGIHTQETSGQEGVSVEAKLD